MIDFTNCKIIPGRAYNGANGKKIAVSYEGEIYMLKFPPSAAKKPTDLSYSNSCISEHIASSIYNMIGIRAQKTLLGTYNVNGKTKIVCACKDFTTGGKRLFDFCSIKNTILDSESDGTGTELDDVLDTIEKQQYISPDKLTEHFWNMFVVDAFLGNFDRHNGNWGFLYDESTGDTEIAPIFDCGSCLLPQADEKVMKAVLSDERELNARVFRFPNSAIRMNGDKINYYRFLTEGNNQDCMEAVKRIAPRIDLEEIREFIDSIPVLPDLQKEFYNTYLSARYHSIILPAFELANIEGIDEAEDDGFSQTM